MFINKPHPKATKRLHIHWPYVDWTAIVYVGVKCGCTQQAGRLL